jgi:hypothetical protein
MRKVLRLTLALFVFVLTTSTAFASGATWTQQTGAGQRNWEAVTSSADGTKLAAVAFNDAFGNPDYIYTSIDGGATWTQQTGSGQHFWNYIASSADGTKLFAAGCDLGDCSTGSKIYISTDEGDVDRACGWGVRYFYYHHLLRRRHQAHGSFSSKRSRRRQWTRLYVH